MATLLSVLQEFERVSREYPDPELVHQLCEKLARIDAERSLEPFRLSVPLDKVLEEMNQIERGLEEQIEAHSFGSTTRDISQSLCEQKS